MAYQVLDAKNELQGLLKGTTLNQVSNISGVFNRAARQLLLDIDPQETKKKTPFTVFDSVYDYGSINDLKGNKVLDIRPQSNRQLNDIFLQKYGQEFDVNKEFTNQPMFTTQFDTYTKTLRIEYHQGQLTIGMNAADSPTSNGVWAVGGNASTIAQDTLNIATGTSSIKFNLTAGGSSGYIENSTMSAIDLSTHDSISSIFLWVYLPTGANFTNVSVRWGSSSANYWTKTVTTNQKGSAFNDGWNLLKLDWSTATQVGSPTNTAFNYIRVTFAYNGTAMNGVHVQQIDSKLPILVDVWYYSKFLFRDTTTGVFQETVTDDSNLINLDTDTYNVFLWQLALQTVKQIQTRDADVPYYMNEYAMALAKYKTIYKSEVQKPTMRYYKVPNPRWSKFLGKRY